MAMDRRAWEIKQQPFDPRILQEIKSFRIEDLNDGILRQNWLEVSKRFSRMKITPDIIQNMNYQQFMTLRCIMSATLGDLSRKTQHQRKKIDAQEQAIAKLKQQQQKLTHIYNDNADKSKQVKQKLERLKKQQEDDPLFSDFIDSQEASHLT